MLLVQARPSYAAGGCLAHPRRKAVCAAGRGCAGRPAARPVCTGTAFALLPRSQALKGQMPARTHCWYVLQGLQLYARAHSLVEAEAPVQQAQARRVSGTPSSGELARAHAPGTPPPAARPPHSVLCSRPGSAPAAQGPQTAQQPSHAPPLLQKPNDDPGKAAPAPGPWPGSVAAWATQPPAYPTAAAALVRCVSKRRAVSPATTQRGQAEARGAERQVLEPIQPASRQACTGLPRLKASREAAGRACQSSRRPGTAPGSMMSSRGRHPQAEPHEGFRAAVIWRAATAMGTSRDPEHRLRVDRARRQMLCAGPGVPDAL